MSAVLLCRVCGQPFDASPSSVKYRRYECNPCRRPRALAYREKRRRPRPSPEQRFWAKVDRRGLDECWPWLAYKNPKGYGVFGLNGRHIPATHFIWSLHHGEPFPEDKLACHSCDHPWCINPRHIWLGTPKDNMDDMWAKGRHPYAGTHCRRGHLFSASPIYPSDLGKRRRCRICAAQREEIRRAAAA